MGIWQFKLLTQFVLAHVPGGVRLNYWLQRAHGRHTASGIGARIPELAEIIAYATRDHGVAGAVVVEVGTGWEPITALLFSLLGASRIYTYDHLPHVRYLVLKRVLEQLEQRLPDIARITGAAEPALRDRLTPLLDASSVEDVLTRARIDYRAPADATRTGLPDAGADMVFSYAVLEHVPEAMVIGLTAESRRILRPGGIAFHAIGLHDHYANFDDRLTKVNFLKYPEWFWRLFVKNKISYHNRLREKDFLELFAAHRGRVLRIRNTTDQRSLEALHHMRLAPRFAGMTPQELAVTYSEVLLAFD
jgi:SAM-dependent methyltransferase